MAVPGVPVSWLLLAWKFLRSLPKEVWLVILFGLAIFCALRYQAHREAVAYRAGLAQGRAEHAAAVERGEAEIARLDAANALADERARLQAQAAEEKRTHGYEMALAARDRTIAGLRDGTLKLRHQFQGCLSASQGPTVATGTQGGKGPPARPEDAQDLAGAVSDSIHIADTADADVKALWSHIDVIRAQCGEQR